MSPFGNITRTRDGGVVLTYERMLDKSPAQVWAALTEPAILSRWLGRVDVDLRIGGAFVIHFHGHDTVMTGVIQKLETEKLIEYTWLENYGMPQSLVRWTVSPRNGQTRLTLTHLLPPGCKAEDIISFCSGWQGFLDRAAVALAGDDGSKAPFDKDAWATKEAHYTKQFAAAPVRAIDGTLTETSDGGLLLRFERPIERPVARIWRALVDPGVLANWLGEVEIEPRVGGKFNLTFRESGYRMTGAITMFEPERVLEYTWFEPTEAPEMPQSLVRWELQPAPTGCRLVLTQRFPKGCARHDILPFFGGWEAFLDVLPQGADGTFVAYAGDEPYAAHYRAKFA